MAALPLFAERVDPETARKVATTFLNNNGAKAAQLTDLSKAAGYANLYIFNGEEGFVVLSADDRVQPILGYSLTGKFVVEGMPEHISSWLQGYSDEIQYAIDHQIRATIKTTQLWNDLLNNKPDATKTAAVVGPLIQTKWDQNSPYNNLCPSNTLTGCVATAMAQVVKYWNYPTRGIGSHSYQYQTYGKIAADFGATVYDWGNMPDTCLNTSTSAQKEAVATLMHHCGVMVEMQYGPSESGSNINRSSIGMATYFNYNTSYLEKKNYSDTKWSDTLKYELDNNRPILYSGSGNNTSGKREGHAFVCDGYDDAGNFHFNWGWSGNGDGYFPLSALTPGSHNFSEGQLAVIGICPRTDGTTPLALENNQTSLTWTDTQGCSSYNIYRNDALIATTTERSYTDPNPFYGTNKYYVRGHLGTVLSLPSNYVTVNVDYPTPIASQLHAETSDNNVVLSWEAPEWCYPSTADGTTFSYVDEERQTNKDSHYIWPEGDFVLSWGHRYPAEILTTYNGKAIHEISFFSMYPGAFDVVVYQETMDDKPVTEITRESITTSRIGWSRVGLRTPVIVDSSQDLWIFISNTDFKVHTIYNNNVTGNQNGCYYSNLDPTVACGHDTGNNIVWMICAYLTDGSYTYNLYDGITRLNSDAVADTSYTHTSPTANTIHQYTVKTNYYGGESPSSNIAGVSIGTPDAIGALTLGDNDQMTLSSGSILTVSGAITNDNPANLIIEDGAQLIHNGSTVNATLKKTINAFTTSKDGWYTIASPVDELDVDLATTGDYDLYAYDEESVYWLNQKKEANHIEQFQEGQGFLYANAAQQSLAFAGSSKATNTTITVPLSYQSSNADLKGFNLVGNPFTRNLSAGDITLGGTALTTYYVVEGGSELTPRVLTDKPIKPGQGFLVQATATGQDLVFNPGTKDLSDSNPAYICIEAGDGNFTDRVYVQFGEGNTLHKMTLDDNHVQISVRHDNADYAAITLDKAENFIPVSFKVHKNGEYTLTVSATLNSHLSTLNLVDNLTGAKVDLLQTPSYSFEAMTSDYESRFKLVFGESENNGSLGDEAEFIDWKTQIIDMTGRVVATDRNAQLAPGVYILKTVNGNQINTKKIIIK